MIFQTQDSLWFFENMDRVNRAIQGAADLDPMMNDVLGVVLEVLDCDRAFLMYPCDPDAPTWRAPMERTKPEFPGSFALNLVFLMHDEIAATLRLLLASDEPVMFGAKTGHPLPKEQLEPFDIKSFMSMAIHPKGDKPWQFGVHQCSFEREWTKSEQRFLREVGRRLADGLTSRIAYKNLQENERALRETRAILETTISNFPGVIFRMRYLADNRKIPLFSDGRSVRYPRQGITRSRSPSPEEFPERFHPDDRHLLFVEVPRRLRETGKSEMTFRYIQADGTVIWSRAFEQVVEFVGDEMVTEGLAYDVTEEMEARLALEASERELKQTAASLQAIIDNLPGAVFRLRYLADGEKRFLAVPRSDARLPHQDQLVDLSPEQVRGLIHPDDHALVFDEVRRRLLDAGFAEHKHRVLMPDGSFRWRFAAETVIERKGDEMIVEGVTIDITDEMNAKQAVERLNRVLKTLSEGNEVLVRAVDETDLYTNMCRVIVETGGYRLAWVGIVEHDPGKSIRPVAHAGRDDGYLSRIRIGWSDDEWGSGPTGRAVRFGQPQINNDTANNPVMMPWRAGALERDYRASISLPLTADQAVFGVLVIYSAETFVFGPEETALLTDLAGNISYGVSTMRERRRREDTERWFRQDLERSERELRSTAANLQAIVDNLPGNVFRFLYPPDGWKRPLAVHKKDNVLSYQDEWLDLSPEQIRAYIHPDDHVLVFDDVHRLLRENGHAQHKHRIVNADGSISWRYASETVVERNGDDLIVEGLSIDITDEMEARQAVERLNRVLETLSEGNEVLIRAVDETDLYTNMCRVIVETGGYRLAWVGIVEHDQAKTIRPAAYAGHDDGYLAQVRISWAENEWGYGPSGMAVRTGLPQINNNTAENPVMAPWRQAALERGYQTSIALPLKSDKGVFGILTIYALETNAFGPEETALFADLAGNISYGVSAMRERRRNEEMERHFAQVEKMEALGQLAGGVAHDFNNLLGAMLGFARFIAEDAADDNPARYFAQRIIAAGKRGKALVGQILSFARQGEVKREPVVLERVMDDIRVLIEASLPSTTRVTFENADPQAVVNSNADHLIQLLLNLCINAHDAMEGRPGGVSLRVFPTVASGEPFARLMNHDDDYTDSSLDAWTDEAGTAHAVSGSLDPARDYVSIVVSDSGCGMDEKLLEKIFAPFFTTKAKGMGTGLGLAAAQGMVLSHHGALAVESKVGTGTRFEIILPRSREHVVETPVADRVALATCRSKARVLLVDDDPDFGDMLLNGLERFGFEVSPCSYPEEALEAMRDQPDAWDVVITDQTMPGMSGLDLIREIRKFRPDLPCLLCTGFSEYHLDGPTLDEVGVFALMHKPVDLDLLVEKLDLMVASLPDRDPVLR